MQGLPSFDDENLLVGAEHFSDAGVYRIADGIAIVQSLDFFPPLVDDPFLYGQIAAANSLSDVYALGGTPKTALNIVGFPDDKLPLSVLHTILQGGTDRVQAADAVIVGGHTVRDAEIKYGLSVTGVVNPQKMLTNGGARPGDRLVLTKALGTSFVTTAHRAGRCPDNVLDPACASMLQLNRAASESAVAVAAHAVTDITGFGLAGHAYEIAQASDVTMHLELGQLPLLQGVEALVEQGNLTRANATNRAHVSPGLQFEAGTQEHGTARTESLFDPQTSGGLLIAVEPQRADELVDRCRQAGLEAAAPIGFVETKQKAYLRIHP